MTKLAQITKILKKILLTGWLNAFPFPLATNKNRANSRRNLIAINGGSSTASWKWNAFGLARFFPPRYLEPTKFVILRIFWQNLVIFVKFGFWWNLKSLTLKFENLKSLTLTQTFSIWTQIFWILVKKILPKLTKLVISRNLKSLTLKSKIWNPQP